MTVKTDSALDLDAFRRSYEAWDIPALLDLYAEDVEVVSIGSDNPPESPKVRRGRAVMEGMFSHCAGAGVEARITNQTGGEGRATATVNCTFPGGREVQATSVLDVSDGKIVREIDIYTAS